MRIVSLIKKKVIWVDQRWQPSDWSLQLQNTQNCQTRHLNVTSRAFNLSSWHFFFFFFLIFDLYTNLSLATLCTTHTGCYLTLQNSDCTNAALGLSNLLRSRYIWVLSSEHSWSTKKKGKNDKGGIFKNASFVQQPVPKPKRRFIYRLMRKKHTSFYT